MDTDSDPGPDRQALDVDPDPAKWCRSDRIRIHNTENAKESNSFSKNKKQIEGWLNKKPKRR